MTKKIALPRADRLLCVVQNEKILVMRSDSL